MKRVGNRRDRLGFSFVLFLELETSWNGIKVDVTDDICEYLF